MDNIDQRMNKLRESFENYSNSEQVPEFLWDNLKEELNEISRFLTSSLNKHFNKEDNKEVMTPFKIEKTDKEGYYINITNAKYKEFLNIKNIEKETIINIYHSVSNSQKIDKHDFKSKDKYLLKHLTVKSLTNNKKIRSVFFYLFIY